jgi:hypothetical protein
MNIADIGEWGKAKVARIPPHAATVLILVLSSTASFGLGVLAGRDMASPGALVPVGAGKGGLEVLDASGVRVTPGALPAAAIAPILGVPGQGSVASKSGTKYYLPTCSGVGRIKEENKVWYATKADAEAAGLTPAANCPGI